MFFIKWHDKCCVRTRKQQVYFTVGCRPRPAPRQLGPDAISSQRRVRAFFMPRAGRRRGNDLTAGGSEAQRSPGANGQGAAGKGRCDVELPAVSPYDPHLSRGAIAQPGERNTGSVEVGGSIPPGSTNYPVPPIIKPSANQTPNVNNRHFHRSSLRRVRHWN